MVLSGCHVFAYCKQVQNVRRISKGKIITIIYPKESKTENRDEVN